MSYSRWSSPLDIDGPCPECGRLPVVEYGDDPVERFMAFWEDRRKRMPEGGGYCRACTSDWYIYWDCNSGDSRDSQMLAVWGCKAGGHGLTDYPAIRAIVDSGDYRQIPGFAESGDQGILESSLREWLEDVEAEYQL